MEKHENVLPPSFKSHYALYVEYLDLLRREGVKRLPTFKFAYSQSADSLWQGEYLIHVDWLKDQLISELLVTRFRFTEDDMYKLMQFKNVLPEQVHSKVVTYFGEILEDGYLAIRYANRQ